MKPLNRLLLFFWACIPGCGQMYQGYMKRGTSISAAFWIVIAIGGYFYISPLLFILPVLWLYAFFDTFNLRRAVDAGLEEPDTYLLGLSSFDREQLSRLLGRRHSLIGWSLLAVGLWLLWQEGMDVLFDFLGMIGFDSDNWYSLRHMMRYDVPQLIVILAVILLGIWFIRGPKNKPSDEFASFVPPEPAASPVVPQQPAPTPAAEPLHQAAETEQAVENPPEQQTAEGPSDGSAPSLEDAPPPVYEAVLKEVEARLREDAAKGQSPFEVNSHDGE